MRLACLAVFAVTLTFLAPQPARTVAPDRFAPLQEGARQIIRPELPGSVIRGRVVAGDTGLPVPDAAVALVTLGSLSPGTARDVAVPGPQSNIIVDSAGRFEIGGVAPGLYRLVASPGSTAAQYLTGRLPDPRFDDPPVLALFGQELIAGIEIRLPRAAVITGRVVDDRGSPIAGVRVSAQAVLAGNRPGTVRQSGLLPTTTDDTGSFRLFGLPEGDYLVHAQPMVAGHMTMVFPTGESVTRYGRRYAAAYYPGSDTPSHAIPIRVAAGDTYGPIEVPLTDARVFTVRGILLDPSGQPGSSTPVFLRRAGTARATPGFEWPIARPVMDDGTFEFTGISPGDYVVSVNRFRGEVREFGLASVPVYGDVDGVTIRVQSGAMVTGQVFFDGPVPPSLGGLQVRSVPSGAMVLDAISVEPNAEGRFLLPHQYGPTLVRIDGLRGWHLKAVVYGGQDITDTPVEWLERGPALQVFLTDRAATVSGIVRTARGSAVDAAVLLISDDPARFHEHSTTTSLTLAGGDGAFRIEGVRAGRYFAIAVGQDEAPLAGLTREYFDLLARYATPVVVHDGQHTTLDLVLRQLR